MRGTMIDFSRHRLTKQDFSSCARSQDVLARFVFSLFAFDLQQKKSALALVFLKSFFLFLKLVFKACF